MSTKSKVIVTISSLLLVVALIVMGIFAFSRQTYMFNNVVNVSATQNVNAEVTVGAKNDGSQVEINRNVLDFVYDTERESSGYIIVPAQTLKQKGSKLEITININNREKAAYGITMALNEQSIKTAKDKNVSIDFKYVYDGTQLDGFAAASTQVISPGKTMTVVITITLQSEVYNIDENTSINLTLSYVE